MNIWVDIEFEGYKLQLIAQEDAVKRLPLEFSPTQATVSGHSPLSFQEVYSRITHNHIAPSPSGNFAVYVDAEYRVISVKLDSATAALHTSVIFELPKPAGALQDERHREYPSIAFLDSETLFLSDGHGLLYVLVNATIYAIFQYDDLRPFRIHSVTATSNGALAVLSSRHYNPSTETKKPSHVEFDVDAAHFSLPVANSSPQPQNLDIRWSRKGKGVPTFASYIPSYESFLLIGGTPYTDAQSEMPNVYEPSPDEMAPIPRQGENLDTPKPPPPYSWTQTSDSLTVMIPLPSTTSKNDISVIFAPKTLSLHIESAAPTPFPLPHYVAQQFWDGIDASVSYWTWDREGTHTCGLLSLHIEKQHEGTKWMQVFANDTTEVTETLDPSELWHIRESLEKYTSALKESNEAGGLMPSLADGEMDDEVDSNVGRESYLTWVDEGGKSPSWFDAGKQAPFHLLSTPIPGMPLHSLVAKTALDGVVYALSGEDIPTFTHSSTFSALAFVLASKQDTRFTFHTTDSVLAFESGARGRGGNMYVYRATPSLNDLWAKQSVLQVMDGSSGSLLGICALEKGSVIIALTEKEIVLIRGVVRS